MFEYCMINQAKFGLLDVTDKKPKLVVERFSKFFLTNLCSGLQDRVCEIRPIWMLA